MNNTIINPAVWVEMIREYIPSEKMTFGEKKTLTYVKAFFRNVENLVAYVLENNITTYTEALVSYSKIYGKILFTLAYNLSTGEVLLRRSGVYLFPQQGHICYIILNNGSKIDLNNRNLQIPPEKLPLLIHDPKLGPLVRAKLQGLL